MINKILVEATVRAFKTILEREGVPYEIRHDEESRYFKQLWEESDEEKDLAYRQAAPAVTIRPNNNANSVKDFGRQGSNGWMYMYGTEQGGYNLVSHESNGEYIDRTSPSLSIKKDFVHPALNHSAVYAWKPAVEGNVDLRIKYTKFEQHDGNPDFPDGVRLKAYQNGTLLYQQHVDVRDSGDNKVKYRIPSLFVRPSDTLFFVIDPEDEKSTTQYIPRETLRRVSTPQAYKFGKLDWAYHEAFEKEIGIYGSSYTNTMMVELGERLYFAAGSDKNIKLTTKDDLEMFKAYLKSDKDNWLK